LRRCTPISVCRGRAASTRRGAGEALGRVAGIDEPVVPDAARQLFTVRMQGYRALAEAECAAEQAATRRYN
jgi:hypothetical protein